MNSCEIVESLLFEPEWKDQPAWLGPAKAWFGHFPFAAWLIRNLQPRTFVELGTHYGSSYFCFCQAIKSCQTATKAIAVDTWRGDEQAGYYNDAVYEQVFRYNTEQYGGFSTLLRKTFDDARKLFSERTVDLLHIDGLHTYEAVSHDFAEWLPAMSDRGVIVLHDTCVDDPTFGVERFFDEVKYDYPAFTFNHSGGLGIIAVGQNVPPAIIGLIEATKNAADALNPKRIFSLLGQRFEMQGKADYITPYFEYYKGLSALRETEIQRTCAERDGLAANNKHLSQENARLLGEIRSIKSSLLWRSTLPIRWLDKQRFLLSRRVAKVTSKWAYRLKASPKAKAVNTPNYAEWIAEFEGLSDDEFGRILAQINEAKQLPQFSIIMPIYNTPADFLEKAISSIRRQSYPHWELCIADDHSSNPEIHAVLEQVAGEDPRVKVAQRAENGGIVAASNTALELASYEWLALVDHDDLLSRHALLFMAREIARFPDAKILYSDEDKIDEQDVRHSPYFKSDWNKYLFYSQNLITHLGVYRTDLVREVGGFREGTEGSQDYDLALRCMEKIDDKQIKHVPRILYHWRVHPESTADSSSNAKPYAMLNGQKVLNEHFSRKGVHARAELIGHGYRLHFRLPEELPLVSVIIATKDHHGLISRCLKSLLEKTDYRRFEVILVDNGTTEEKAKQCLQHYANSDNVRVLSAPGPFNYSELNNRGVENARGDLVVLLNNDIELVEACWMKEMVSLAIQPDVGCVGALLLYPDETVQHAGVVTGIGGWAGHAHRGFDWKTPGYGGRLSLVSEYSAVTGACLMVRRALFEEAGALDEANLKIACNDVDLCLRIKSMGYRNVFTPHARLIHHESASRGYEDTPEKKARFEREVAFMHERWGELLSNDLCYNPNLTLAAENFGLAWPSRAVLR